MVEAASILGFTFLGVVAFAALWRYSDLPDIDWSHITIGVLFFLSARGIAALGPAWTSLFPGVSQLGQVLTNFFSAWAAVFDLLGAALVVEGALRNAYELYQE